MKSLQQHQKPLHSQGQLKNPTNSPKATLPSLEGTGPHEPAASVSKQSIQHSTHPQKASLASSNLVPLLHMNPKTQSPAAYSARANAKAPQNTYMKDACKHGGMQTLDMERGTIGSVPPVVSDID